MAAVYSKGPVPSGLRTAGFVLRPISRDDAENDHAAVMESRDVLRLWEQSTWPEDDFTVEADREDLADLEDRHQDGRAFTYTVLDPGGDECLGCVYVFPPDATFLARSAVTPVGRGEWADVDVVVYFWVRRSRMGTGMDARLLSALRTWFAEDWSVEDIVFVTNEQFVQQVDLIRRSGLRPAFELREPGKPGTYLAFR